MQKIEESNLNLNFERKKLFKISKNQLTVLKNVIKIKCRLVSHLKFNTEEVIFLSFAFCLKKPF